MEGFCVPEVQSQDPHLNFLVGGGELGRLIRGHDWSSSPLGSPDSWSQALRSAVAVALGSQFPMFVAWGPELGFLYNDAYAVILGDKHPAALGAPFRDVWAEIWPDISPLVEAAMAGEATYRDNLPLVVNRRGGDEQAWFTFSYSPMRDEHGAVAGMFCAVAETTGQVLAERALRAERDRAQGVLDHMGEGFVLLDRDLRVVDMNAEAIRMEGRPREAIIGKPHGEAHPDAAPGLGELYRKALRERHAVSLDHRRLDADGRESWIEMRAYPVGQGLAVFYRDVTDRKQAETVSQASKAALEESEIRFRTMADHAPVMTWVTDAAGYCIYLNARWYEFTDQAPGQGEAYGWLDAVHPEDRPKAEAAFVAANAERRNYRVDFRLRRADGVYRWVIDAAAARFTADGEYLGYIGSVIDIEERKEAETLLEQRVADALAEKRLLAQIVDETDASVQVVDSAFRFLAINETATGDYERVFGVRPSVGQSVLDILAPFPAEREAAQRLWTRALRGETFSVTRWWGDAARDRRAFETRFRALTDGQGQEIGAFLFGQDVTERLREQERLAAAEAARREADALYRAYFENTAEALFVVNVLEDGGFTIEDLNPAHQASIGLPLAEVRGERIDVVLPPDLAEPVIAHYRRALTAQAAYQYRETFQLHGRTTYWDTVLVPVRDGAGRIVRLIGSSRDLTPQVAAEEQLRQSQKMEAMGQLTGGVAHDFNNLLTPIVGSLDMLMRRGLGNEREQRLISGAMQSAERAKTLVQRLLAFARRQPLQPSAVDLPQLVNGMAGLMGSTLGPKVDIRVQLAAGLPPARADANQLEMALLNLAVNARDAMPDGGALTISAARESVRAEHASKLKLGHYVRLSVADTGSGMDAETLKRAVEPFFSTKGIGKGTGLGLSMVHGLAAQLGGGLTIASEPGRGTTVELWLPISTEALADESNGQRKVEPARTRGRALLVDDEELVRMTTADMLTDLGYDVVEASSAEEALHLLMQGAAPDLLVTDHLMPGMSGAELARETRLLKPDLPILIVSGYADVDGIAPDLPRLTKPFRNAELVERLTELGALKAPAPAL